MMTTLLDRLSYLLRLLGSLLVSFGLIRDLFGNMYFQKGFNDAKFEDPEMGHILNTVQDTIFHLGAKVGLIFPPGHPMTMIDLKVNAEAAILGFLFLVTSLLFALFVKLNRMRG